MSNKGMNDLTFKDLNFDHIFAILKEIYGEDVNNEIKKLWSDLYG